MINKKMYYLESCSTDPMTGWFRDGCCNTDKNDWTSYSLCKS